MASALSYLPYQNSRYANTCEYHNEFIEARECVEVHSSSHRGRDSYFLRKLDASHH